MKDFAAIDFETANFERTSVCSVGVVVVRDGENRRFFLFPHSARTELLYLSLHAGARTDACRHG